MIAVLLVTTDSGGQREAGRIRIVNGKLVGTPPGSTAVAYVLSQPAFRHDTGELVSPDGDPVAFLAALPAAYTGAMFRVGLEDETRRRAR